MKKFRGICVRFSVLAVLIFGCFWMGCTGVMQAKPSESATVGETAITPDIPKPTARYYDFEDVLVPLDLKIVQGKTVVISTPGYTSGIIAFKGRVERRSLVNFFINNMQKDNWGVVSQIKSPENSILIFDKASKCSVISIKSDQFYTHVEIGVAPKMGENSLIQGQLETNPSGVLSQNTLTE